MFGLGGKTKFQKQKKSKGGELCKTRKLQEKGKEGERLDTREKIKKEGA